MHDTSQCTVIVLFEAGLLNLENPSQVKCLQLRLDNTLTMFLGDDVKSGKITCPKSRSLQMLVALCSANNTQEHETYTVTLEDLVLKSAVRFLNEVEESLYFERSAIDTDA